MNGLAGYDRASRLWMGKKAMIVSRLDQNVKTKWTICPDGLCAPPEVAIIITNFFLFFSIAFDPLRGNSRGWKFVSPQYFGITRRYMQKNRGILFIFFTKKNRFSSFYGQRLVMAAWATPSPWSIKILFWYLQSKYKTNYILTLNLIWLN